MDQEWGKKGLLPGVLGGQQGPTKAMLVVGGHMQESNSGPRACKHAPHPSRLSPDVLLNRRMTESWNWERKAVRKLKNGPFPPHFTKEKGGDPGWSQTKKTSTLHPSSPREGILGSLQARAAASVRRVRVDPHNRPLHKFWWESRLQRGW